MAMRKVLFCGFLAISVLLSIVSAGPVAAGDEFYDGETITVIVGLRAGGTADTFARTFSNYWEKHIPGNPKIIVKNMPGGGNMKATNYVYEKAKPDGMTVVWGPWIPVGQALGQPQLRARYEDFEFIGGTGDIRISYCRSDIIPGGMKKPADIMKAKPFKVGGNNPSGISDLLARMSLDVLGVKYNYVTGYSGGSGIFAAMKRNEVQYSQTSITTFRTRSADFIKSGEGIGLFYMTAVDENGQFKTNPYITEMPAFPELYRQIYGKMPSGEIWDALNWMVGLVGELTFAGLAPPGAPKEAVEALRKGYEGASNDPDFINGSIKKFNIPYTFVGPEQGMKIIRSLRDVDPKVVDTLKKVVASGSK